VARALKSITPRTARRLAIVRQRLAGPRPTPDRSGIMEVVRDLGCLQVDPVSVVARSHEIVLWSRLGPFPVPELEALRWDERRLFDYWAHAASIVPTEDFPIHQLFMRTYPSGRTIYGRRAAVWMKQNEGLRRHVLSALRRRGPLRMRDLEDRSVAGWRSSGWTNDRNVSQMLHYLWFQGKVLVAGRSGIERWWDLAAKWLPEWTPRQRLPERQVVRLAAQRSLRALGIGTQRHIDRHFTVGRYPGLPSVLKGLQREGLIEAVQVSDGEVAWPGPWYVHAMDLPMVERLEAGEWEPPTTLLSPFDNLINDRARVEQLYGFRYRLEIYVPKAKRRYGPYVLPILDGDRFVGRVDAATDRRRGRLVVAGIHAEPDAPMALEAGWRIAEAVRSLAVMVNAPDVELAGAVPDRWRRAFG